ncbi:MAG: nuclear transport factor 2 family protein [Acidimicrobiales bacterium]
MAKSAAEVAEGYFACMRNGDAGVAELFHEDARLVGLGTVVSGRPAIAEFYSHSIRNASPAPRAAAPLAVEGNRVLAEVFIDLANGITMHVVDLFEIDGELIRTLTYFVSDHP